MTSGSLAMGASPDRQPCSQYCLFAILAQESLPLLQGSLLPEGSPLVVPPEVLLLVEVECQSLLAEVDSPEAVFHLSWSLLDA